MGPKILASLIIYLMLYHTQKCVTSETNLTGSLKNNNNPSETSFSKSKNPPDNLASVVTSPSTPAPVTEGSGASSAPAKAADATELKQALNTPEAGKPKPIQLDIKSKNKHETTNEYEYKRKEITKVATFTAKPGYEFNKVYKKKDSLNCLGSDDILWLAENESQYATKVVVDGVGSGKKKVFIYFKNESYKRFWKMNKKWEEIVILPKNDSLLIKIITLDLADNTKTKENDTSQYNVNRENSDRENYIFNNDAKCVELKIGDKTVWKYDENKTYGYPKSILVWKKQSVLVKFERGVVKCNKEDNGWKVKEDFGGMYVAVSQPTECKSREEVKKESDEIEDTSDEEEIKKNQNESSRESSEDGVSAASETKPSVPESGSSTDVPESGSGYEGEEEDSTPSTPSEEDTAQASTPTTLVELDVSHRRSCNKYEYVKKDNVQTYTAKPGYEFNKVVNGNDELWNPINDKYEQNATLETDEYGNKYIKVVLRGSDSKTSTTPEPQHTFGHCSKS